MSWHRLLLGALLIVAASPGCGSNDAAPSGPSDTQESRIYYVDDYDSGTGRDGALWPTDEEEEAFWDELLSGYAVTKFDAESRGDVPTEAILCEATTVIWYVDDDPLLAAAHDRYNSRNPLPQYVRSGGNLILCGDTVTDAFTPDNGFDPRFIANPGCPHEPRNTYETGAAFSLDWFPALCDTGCTFVYDLLKLRRSFYHPAHDFLDSLISSGSILPGSRSLPSLGTDWAKRKTLPNSEIPLLSFGLEDCEQYEPRLASDPSYSCPGDDITPTPLWRFQDPGGEVRGVCGVYVPKSESRGTGHVVVLGFPPYFFKTDEMREAFRTLLDIFGEIREG